MNQRSAVLVVCQWCLLASPDKRRVLGSRQKDQHADRPKAQNAAEALKNLPAPPPGQPTAPFQAKNVPFSKTKFTRQMVEAQINKPMGLVLEENHPSVKVSCTLT